MPTAPKQLLAHNRRLGANYMRVQPGCPLSYAQENLLIPATGNVQASDREALRRLALTGLGLARLAVFQVCDDIDLGRLPPVLEECNPGDVEEIHAVYGRQGRLYAASRAGLFDFLAERVNISAAVLIDEVHEAT